MVMEIKILDKIHLQKYIYLISLFVANELAVSDFEKLFLQIRGDDEYWLSDSFDKNVGKILDTFFLDVSDYTPDELSDPEDPNEIDEGELRIRAKDVFNKLKEVL